MFIFFCCDDEYWLFFYFSLSIEYTIQGIYSISHYDRYSSCDDIGIEYDESWYLRREHSSACEIDESDIDKKPKETIGEYQTDLLNNRGMSLERIESSSYEHNTPDDHSRYDKWYELLI